MRETFVRKVRLKGRSFVATIPRPLAGSMGMEDGELLCFVLAGRQLVVCRQEAVWEARYGAGQRAAVGAPAAAAWDGPQRAAGAAECCPQARGADVPAAGSGGAMHGACPHGCAMAAWFPGPHAPECRAWRPAAWPGAARHSGCLSA